MPLNIISNFAANVAQRNLAMSDAAATNSLAKLSAGSRVLAAKDDAAALAIGSRLKAEVAGLKQAAVNAGQAISMLQIADGAMAKVSDILTRMKTLAVQAGSGQLSATERGMLDTEYQALRSEVDRIASDTEFGGSQLVNGSKVLDLSSAGAFSTDDGIADIVLRGDHTGADATIAYDVSGSFTVTTDEAVFTGALDSETHDGSNMNTATVITLSSSASTNKIDIVIDLSFDVDLAKSTGTIAISGSTVTSFDFKVGTGTSSTADQISVSVNSVAASALSIGSTSVTTASSADAASAALSNAIDDVQTYRATIGASQNRLEFAKANIATTTENTEAARSQLMDLDVAAEMSNFTSKQILVQAGVAMLAQANQLPQGLLRLFN